jgi:hypothetical protein
VGLRRRVEECLAKRGISFEVHEISYHTRYYGSTVFTDRYLMGAVEKCVGCENDSKISNDQERKSPFC